MLARNETIFKWALYAGATAVFFFLQGAILQRVTLWGVIPFVFPILAAVMGTYEAALPSSIYGLVVGVLCDLLLFDHLPCFYTLIFPIVGLCAALVSRNLLPADIPCAAINSVLAFLLTDLFHCLLLWFAGQAAWTAGAWLFLREAAVSILLVIPAALLFSAVFRRTHRDD